MLLNTTSKFLIKLVGIFEAILIILVLLLASLIGFKFNQIRTLASLQLVNNYPFYTMQYYGDYGFQAVLTKGKRSNPERSKALRKALLFRKQGPEDILSACSAFSAINPEDQRIVGRNFDYYTVPVLLLFTNPPHAYASVSMVNLNSLGYSRPDVLPHTTWPMRFKLLWTPHFPSDGMNECGLVVASLAVPHAEYTDDPHKVTLSLTQVIRLLLDYAKNVDEAIALVQKYNIDASPESKLSEGHHLFIADASGKSAIIEFIHRRIIVLKNTQPWQVVTNFVVDETKPAAITCERYKLADQTLTAVQGKMNEKAAMVLLGHVSQFFTTWSIVYNSTNGDIQIALGKNYHQIINFRPKAQPKHIPFLFSKTATK
jgi:hypothetical protein